MERILAVVVAICLCTWSGGAVRAEGPPRPLRLVPRVAYTQNFNQLAAEGNDHPFPPNSSHGWWASPPTYSASSGRETVGGMFSFGEKGSAERALGSLVSNQVRHTAWGVAFLMTEHFAAEDALWAVEIAYNGEQWSVSGNGSSTLVFDFSIVTEHDYEKGQKWGFYDETPGLWMVKDALSFASPVIGGEQHSLNGNDPANRRAIRHTLAIDDWGPGRILQLRWTHRNSAGGRHALAVDDLWVYPVRVWKHDPATGGHHARGSPWVLAGVSIVGVAIVLVIAVLVITLIVKRRRNVREGQHGYSLLRAAYEEDAGDPPLGDNTSINPTDAVGRTNAIHFLHEADPHDGQL